MFLEGVNSLQKVTGKGTELTFHRVFGGGGATQGVSYYFELKWTTLH